MNFGTIQVANIFVGTLNAIEAYFGTQKVWGKSEPATANWLCFTAEKANSTVAMKANGSAPTVSLEFSTDGNTWNPFVVGSTKVTLANIGDKMYMRATSAGNTGMGSSLLDYNQFVMTGKIAASGNVDTLLDQNGNATLMSYCYYRMFYICSSLTSAPEFPSTTLADNCYYEMFRSCSSLTSAPSILPATTLADSCYRNMFYKCTSLTSAPALPATTLAKNCYGGMFSGCTSLASAPELPATTLDAGCYSNMFQSCSSLTTAPELPATTLASNCYNSMFFECSSLTSAPALPATRLAPYCYNVMFSGCTSLASAPELPATTLDAGCYSNMFQSCSSLTTAPELPATTLASNCYNSMFNGCSILNTIKLGYTGNFADAPSKAFDSWVNGVASTGTFYYNGSDTTTGVSAIPTGWTVVKSSQELSALCFTAEEANSTLHLDKSGSPDAISLETSTDGSNWTDYTWSGNTGTTLTLTNIGDKVYMRAKTENPTIGSSNRDYYKFLMTGKIAASGNIQTLLKADGSRTDAPAHCYYYMFQGCSSLTTAPELPATTLAEGCYDNMFMFCRSLTSAPELPATTLGTWCYSSMFNGCSSLKTAPSILPATTLVEYCYYRMFNGCSSLKTAPDLPATTLAEYCYSNMFDGCSSLKTAPELPATTLAYRCYRDMFNGCSILNTIKLAYTGNFSTDYFNNWVNGVASTGTFYYNGSDTTTGNNAIPRGWTVTQFTS